MGNAHLVLYLVYIPFPFQILDRPLQLSEKEKRSLKLAGFRSSKFSNTLLLASIWANTDTPSFVTTEGTN